MVKNKNVYIMYSIVFLQGLVFYGPIATVYRESRGITLSEIFMIESISWLLAMLLEVPWGWFADRFGYKRTLIISNFIFFISKIVFFKSYSISMFLLERVLLAFSVSGLSGCDTALLYSSIKNKENSEKIFGMYNSFSTVGFLIACIASYFIINISMDLAALITIIPYGIATGVTFFISEHINPSKNRNDILNNLKSVFKNKDMLRKLISFALVTLVVQSVTVFLNQGQYVKSGINARYFGLLLAINQVIRLSASKSYRLSNKYGQVSVIRIMYIMIGVSCLSLVVINNSLLSVILILLISLGSSLINPIIMDMQNKGITTENRATMLSIYSMIISVVTAIINPFIGLCADSSIELAFVGCFTLCVIAYILFRNEKR